MTSTVRTLAHIGVILTGGTIGSTPPGASRVEEPLVGIDPMDAPEATLLQDALRGIGSARFSLRRPFSQLSEDLLPSDWAQLARSARQLAAEGVDGILLLHGTDTMSYSAAALSFMLSDIDVPVVLTGSNLPPGQPDSDAVENVRDAIIALRYLPRGVFLVFGGRAGAGSQVHCGTTVRKVRGSGTAFHSVNRASLASVGEDGFVWHQDAPRYERRESWDQADERVLSLRLHPGINLGALGDFALDHGYHGVMLELFPSATGSGRSDAYSVDRLVHRCTAAGIAVVSALSHWPEGETNVYESTLAIRKAGAIPVMMMPETALVKLMWILGHTRDPATVQALLLEEIAGEMGGR